MSTALATLPTSSDRNDWTPEESALVEAAGLVHTDAQSGVKTLAERATVAAFLQHCARTGLDPIARQIYSIARKSKGQLKWQIQISIDGARLVAERTKQYEGQTTPEFTADGITWTQVWLSKEHPAAARVGVYRRGFREPLYAVALWDAYVQTKYNGEVSEMWSKMGPLMLAKCAEMLALRKAFPQDLSGLYSTEEMQQAEAQQAVEQPTRQVEKAPPAPSRDWAEEIAAVTTLGELEALYRAAEAEQQLGLVVGMTGDNDDGSAHRVMDLVWGRKRELQAASEPEPMVDGGESAPERDWAAEAAALTDADAVRELTGEAEALGADEAALNALTARWQELRGQEPVESSSGWNVAQIPQDEPSDG